MPTLDSDPDPAELDEFLYSQSGGLAFDIGGNAGRVAARLSNRFDRVVSCEPAAESFALLSVVPGVTALQVAVSDHSGTVALAAQEHSIKSGQLTSPMAGNEAWVADPSIVEGGWGRILDTRVVQCTTLDELSDEYGDPDFVKIDVEGHEGRVVVGGLGVLRRARPALYIEVHNAQLGAEIRGYLDSLYQNLREIWHPYYKTSDFGHRNHYWLVSADG